LLQRPEEIQQSQHTVLVYFET